MSLNKYFSFKGRVGRLEYFTVGIITMILSLLINFIPRIYIGTSILDMNFSLEGLGIAIIAPFILTIPLIWISFASVVKRLHDLNLSGFILLIMIAILFIPILGIFIYLLFALALLLFPGTKFKNQYDMLNCQKCGTQNSYIQKSCISCGENLQDTNTSIQKDIKIPTQKEEVHIYQHENKLKSIVQIIDANNFLTKISEIALIEDNDEKYIQAFNLMNTLEDKALTLEIRKEIESRFLDLLNLKKLEKYKEEAKDILSKLNYLETSYKEFSEEFKNNLKTLSTKANNFLTSHNNVINLNYPIDKNSVISFKSQYHTLYNSHNALTLEIKSLNQELSTIKESENLKSIQNIFSSVEKNYANKAFKVLYSYFSFVNNDHSNKDLKLIILKNFNLKFDDSIDLEFKQELENQLITSEKLLSIIKSLKQFEENLLQVDLNSLNIYLEELDKKSFKGQILTIIGIGVVCIILIAFLFKTSIEQYFVESDLNNKYTTKNWS